jgi:hypothetical protein
MEFTLHGFDVYTSEVDDNGIDFIVKMNNQYFDIQVKSARNNNYIFFMKDKFVLRRNLFAAIVLFEELHEPQILLIPSLDWQKPNSLLVSRDYEGKKSKPEWGFIITKRNRELLLHYQFDKVVERLLKINGA